MRYLGNKDSLCSTIANLLKDKGLNKEGLVFFDAFSGTASASNYFKDMYKIIVNDNLYFSFAYSLGRINSSFCTFKNLGFNPFDFFNSNENIIDGFISKNYAPTLSGRSYFSDFNAGRIDYFRTTIEEWSRNGYISKDEYLYLIGCLLESVSKVANVAGVYGACLKTWDSRAVKKIVFIPIDVEEQSTISQAIGYNDDIHNIISNVDCDILYLDPPYTKNRYTTQYHLLETIARYDNPAIKGVTGARDMSGISNAWSTKNQVEIEFDYVLANTKARYILLSYSSDGLMSKDFIISSMKRYGIEETFTFREIPYKKYTNTRSGGGGKHYEYLFFIEKKPVESVRYTCPLNYMGGKTPIVENILRHIPDSETFVDLMGGGFNVGINSNSKHVIYNDINYIVMNLVKMFQDGDTLKILNTIDKVIAKYGLEKANKDAFVKYREEWNNKLSLSKDCYLYLYILLLYGFQQQLRFNSNHKYNNTVGESSYNEPTKEKIVSFSRKIKTMNIDFKSVDFESALDGYDISETTVYIDPPYLITLGSYNDGKRGFNGWTPKDEKRLYNYLDSIIIKGAKIILSNVFEHKGKTNEILLAWINRNNFKIEYIESRGRKEVIICNE